MPRARYVPAKQNGRVLKHNLWNIVSPIYGKTSQIIANTYAINFLELKTQLAWLPTSNVIPAITFCIARRDIRRLKRRPVLARSKNGRFVATLD